MTKSKSTDKEVIIGVDEVGRGPLAGDVFVVALALNANQLLAVRKKASKIKLSDSKKLTEKQRGEWFEWIKENKINFSLSRLSPAVIDRINISQATIRAAQKSVGNLIKKISPKNSKLKIFCDGGIRIKSSSTRIKKIFCFPKADEKIPAVSLASIAAKVLRDGYMEKEAKKYPRYNFSDNKGYGTKVHLAALKKHGPSKIHRLTFTGKCNKIKYNF